MKTWLPVGLALVARAQSTLVRAARGDLSNTSLAWVGRGSVPCARDDLRCWSSKAVAYTNAVRRENGVQGMLRVGPERQLGNAVQYAEALSRRGVLKHQDLGKVTREVECSRWIGGENLAYNYESGDVARACVEQWVGSKGHFANLVRGWFEEAVVGVHIERSGRVYCVQTFGLQMQEGTVGRASDEGCGTGGESVEGKRGEDGSGEGGNEKDEESEGGGGSNGGRAACECIKHGTRCSRGMARESGVCEAGKRRKVQGRRCSKRCCEHCERKRKSADCDSRRVQAVCGRRRR